MNYKYLVVFFLSVISSSTFAKINFSLAGDGKMPQSIVLEGGVDMRSIKINSNKNQFVSIESGDLTRMSLEGYPDLVATGKLFVVPSGFHPVLKIDEVVVQTIKDKKVQPYLKKDRCGPTSLKFDPKVHFIDPIYASKEVFPKNWVHLEKVGFIQGLEVMRLAVYPMRQNFRSQSIELASKISAKVTFEKDRSIPVRAKGKISPAISKLAEKLVINPKSFMKQRSELESIILVTADNYTEVTRPLAVWKAQRGMKVISLTYSQAGGTREALAKKIKEIYDGLEIKPTYVLLVGNASQIPTFTRPTTSGDAASDYPYSLLSGDDALPDVIMGRLVGDNVDEIQNYVRKSIETELNSDIEASWYGKGMTIASSQGFDPSDEEYAEQIQQSMLTHTYSSVDQFYEGKNTATATNIISAVNEGRSWITYIGHGSGTSWGSTNGEFGLTQINQVSNPGKLPIMIDVACLNGSFVALKPCFGKAWMTKKVNGIPVGLSAYYGGSVSVSWDPPAVMAVGIAKNHFEKPAYTIGSSIMAGQLYLIEQMGLTANTIDNLEWYNLFGDPSMIFRTGKQKSLQVSHKFVDSALKLKVTNANGEGLSGVTVAVTKSLATAPEFVGVTSEQGDLTFETATTQSLNGATLTVSGYNSQTVQINL